MPRTKKKKLGPYRIAALVLSAGLLALILGLNLQRGSFPVLQSAGPIASGEQQLLVKAFLLMLIIVVPVFVLTFYFAIRYREGAPAKKRASYRPNWDHNRLIEGIWWTVPTLLIIGLSVMTWRATYAFDPYKPLAAKKDTMIVQVVALDWRWLFIYPEQNIASVNELRLPVDTAVRFDITSDAPMNSFWIPQLGGQMYAMPGMGTRLNLLADKTGTYVGKSANISGEGFAGMQFNTIVTAQSEFDDWATYTQSRTPLTHEQYAGLAKQSKDRTVLSFGRVDHKMYEDIIGKYHGVDHHGRMLDEAGNVTSESRNHNDSGDNN